MRRSAREMSRTATFARVEGNTPRCARLPRSKIGVDTSQVRDLFLHVPEIQTPGSPQPLAPAKSERAPTVRV